MYIIIIIGIRQYTGLGIGLFIRVGSYRFIIYTDASYRFYRSRYEEMSIKKRGKIEEKNRSKRRHERLMRVRLLIMVRHVNPQLLHANFKITDLWLI